MLAARLARPLRLSTFATASRRSVSIRFTARRNPSSNENDTIDLSSQKPLAYSLFRAVKQALDDAIQASGSLDDAERQAIKREAENEWCEEQVIKRIGDATSSEQFREVWAQVRQELADEIGPKSNGRKVGAGEADGAGEAERATPSVRRRHETSAVAGKVPPTYARSVSNVEMKEEKPVRTVSPIFLRDCCRCPLCLDPSGQKLFRSTDIPADIRGTPTLNPSGDEIEIRWDNDIPGFPSDHVTRLPWPKLVPQDMIRHRMARTIVDQFTTHPVIWNRVKLHKDPDKWVEYNDYMTSDDALYKSLKHLLKWGILFLRNVPDSEQSVEHIANRIGCLKETLYGRTWDVKSKPSAENIAYTSHYLGLHQDLLYTTCPPKLQILHSLRAQAPGGESLFSDPQQAVKDLWETNPWTLHVLGKEKNRIPFVYQNSTHSYVKLHRTITWSKHSPYKRPLPQSFHYSPPFQGVINPSGTMSVDMDLEYFMDHLRIFTNEVEKEKNVYELRLKEGECVIFDNERILHARREFDAQKGERWLKGAYVDRDVFESKLQTLVARFESPAKQHVDSLFPDFDLAQLKRDLTRLRRNFVRPTEREKEEERKEEDEDEFDEEDMEYDSGSVRI